MSSQDTLTFRQYTVNLEDGIYYWNVSTYNGLTGFSDKGSFRVCTVTAPTSPTINFPVNGDIAVIPVTLSWTPGSVGKACNPVGNSELLLFMDKLPGRRELSQPNTCVSTLSVDSSFWPVPVSYGEGMNNVFGFRVKLLGTFSWMQIVSNGEVNVSSSIFTFTSCIPEQPGSFNLYKPTKHC